MTLDEVRERIRQGSYDVARDRQLVSLQEMSASEEWWLKYRERQRARLREFKKNALSAFGLTNHPKADRLYKLAWDYGHSAGLEEVLIYLEDLVGLLEVGGAKIE